MINRKKFPTKQNPNNNRMEVSCEEVQKVLEAKASASDPKELLKIFSDKKVLVAQIHLAECEECQKYFNQIKERAGPSS